MIDDIRASKAEAVDPASPQAATPRRAGRELERDAARQGLGPVGTSRRSRWAGSTPTPAGGRAGALNEAREAILEASVRRPPRRAGDGETPRLRAEAERLDLTEVRSDRDAGHLHLVTQTIEELEDVFVGLGFTVAEGPEVEDDWHNFTALNFGEYHPARDMQDTFFVGSAATARW
jgi:phenylalanyl-tRNA synthetase alpha chain